MADWLQRAVGAGLIIFGAATYGAGLARAVRRRAWEIAELEAALQALESEISYGYTPLPEACVQVGRRSAGVVGRLFTHVGSALAREDFDTELTWRRSVRAWATGAHLQAPELEILEALGTVLGRSTAADQARQLQLARERLAGIRRRLEPDVERQSRLRTYLGLAAGAMLALLLV